MAERRCLLSDEDWEAEDAATRSGEALAPLLGALFSRQQPHARTGGAGGGDAAKLPRSCGSTPGSLGRQIVVSSSPHTPWPRGEISSESDKENRDPSSGLHARGFSPAPSLAAVATRPGGGGGKDAGVGPLLPQPEGGRAERRALADITRLMAPPKVSSKREE